VDSAKYAGQPASLKDYDPQHPEEPWQALSTRYLGLMDCCGNVDLRRLFGRFFERKEAEAFLKKLYAESRFARHLNPRFPPAIISPGALLVSEKYTCTLDKENDTLRKANWIVEIEGRLFAGAEGACQQGKRKKTVSMVACDGKKILATDTWAAPCDGSRVDTCLIPMSPGAVGIQQDYSASGEGRQLSFRIYDVKSGRKLFGMWEGYDPAPVYEVTDVKDVDGDGVPELSERRCEDDDCRQTRLRKWDGKRFMDVRLK